MKEGNIIQATIILNVGDNHMTKNIALNLVNIRKMTTNDYSSVYSLWEKTPGMNLRKADDNFTEISRLIKFNPDFCYVAEFDQKVIGTIMGATDGRRGKIYHLAVDEEFRGIKLARKLVSLVSTKLKAIGIRKISICVMKDNELGKNFWEHFGYKKRVDINYFDRIL